MSGRPRETGPCVACGADDWGDRNKHYRRADGSTVTYRSRYCKRCSRRRNRERRWATDDPYARRAWAEYEGGR